MEIRVRLTPAVIRSIAVASARGLPLKFPLTDTPDNSRGEFVNAIDGRVLTMQEWFAENLKDATPAGQE